MKWNEGYEKWEGHNFHSHKSNFALGTWRGLDEKKAGGWGLPGLDVTLRFCFQGPFSRSWIRGVTKLKLGSALAFLAFLTMTQSETKLTCSGSAAQNIQNKLGHRYHQAPVFEGGTVRTQVLSLSHFYQSFWMKFTLTMVSSDWGTHIRSLEGTQSKANLCELKIIPPPQCGDIILY